jgi:hypothetical protein
MSSKTSEKSSSITVRLDPKTKYALEILSRKQHRTISSVVDWALHRAFDNEYEGLSDLNNIWDVEEADRFVKLALNYPSLLNYDEQKIWKIIQESETCWKGYEKAGKWKFEIGIDSISWDNLRSNWDLIKSVASGKSERSKLPKAYISSTVTKKIEEMADDIPF